MKRKTHIAMLTAVVAMTAPSPLILITADASEEASAKILAAHIREQGFPCKKAENAQRDRKQSAPHMTVWTLTCEHVDYRLTLVPDMAAKVERMDK